MNRYQTPHTRFCPHYKTVLTDLCQFLCIGQIIHSDGQEDVQQGVCHQSSSEQTHYTEV